MAESQQTPRMLKTFSLETSAPHGLRQKKSDSLVKLNQIKEWRFSVDFELVYEVHGGYDLGDEDNASLLVIKVIPRPDDRARQFYWFKVALSVLPDETPGQRSDGNEGNEGPPRLISIEPASSGEQFADVFTTNEVRERVVEGVAGAQMYGVGADGKVSNLKRSEFKAHHLLKVRSGTARTNEALSKRWINSVWWDISAANPADGIGDSFTVALLVKRAKGSKFRVKASAEGGIGILCKAKSMFVPSVLRSRKKPALLDVFGPARAGSVQKIPRGVDEKNLHAASTDNVMKRIDEVGLHLPEHGRLVRFERGEGGWNTTPVEGEDAQLPDYKRRSWY
ncbi:hypothetical protein ACET3X_005548 [Alternaria dauci]|uniref:Uncharacterized protein n=1 Tax=Alternaria dauci TaxID=48095 RepID=A0ABR3ULT4_9PLEO